MFVFPLGKPNRLSFSGIIEQKVYTRNLSELETLRLDYLRLFLKENEEEFYRRSLNSDYVPKKLEIIFNTTMEKYCLNTILIDENIFYEYIDSNVNKIRKSNQPEIALLNCISITHALISKRKGFNLSDEKKFFRYLVPVCHLGAYTASVIEDIDRLEFFADILLRIVKDSNSDPYPLSCYYNSLGYRETLKTRRILYPKDKVYGGKAYMAALGDSSIIGSMEQHRINLVSFACNEADWQNIELNKRLTRFGDKSIDYMINSCLDDEKFSDPERRVRLSTIYANHLCRANNLDKAISAIKNADEDLLKLSEIAQSTQAEVDYTNANIDIKNGRISSAKNNLKSALEIFASIGNRSYASAMRAKMEEIFNAPSS